jgi:hypothetical protein
MRSGGQHDQRHQRQRLLRVCLIARGPKGFEGFDSSCKSLGLFDTEQAAVSAILKAPPASSEPLASLAKEGESA